MIAPEVTNYIELHRKPQKFERNYRQNSEEADKRSDPTATCRKALSRLYQRKRSEKGGILRSSTKFSNSLGTNRC